MIIKEITIYGYGKWIDQHFSFTAPVQVVYGPNEAGKSTMIDFIISVLFGFQTKRQAIHGQYIPKNSSAYGGEIVFIDQETTYRLTRTTGTHGGKVDFYDMTHETELSNSDLQKILGPIDRSVYTSFFYFGELDQQAFYKMSIDDLRLRIQQIGISNANDWFELQADLQKKADSLYTPRGRKPLINQQLKEYNQLVNQVETAKDKYPQYDQQTAQLKQLQRATTDQEITELQAKVQEYQHLAQTTPLITKKQQLTKSINQLRSQIVPIEKITEMQQLVMESKNLTKQLASMTNEQPISATEEELIKFLEQHQETIQELQPQLEVNLDLNSQANFLEREITAKQQNIAQQANDLGFSMAELPIPFEADRLGEISQLINETNHNSSRRQQSTSNSAPVISLVVGAVAFIVGLVTHLNWLIILAVLGLGGVGFNWWHSNNNRKAGSTANNDQLTPIEQISQEYHLTGVPVKQWLTIQSNLQSIKRQQAEIQQQTSQLAQLTQQVTEYLSHWQFAAHWLPTATNSQRERLTAIQSTVIDWQAKQTSAEQKANQLAAQQLQVKQKQIQLDQIKVKLQKDYQQFGISDEQQLAKKGEINQEYRDNQTQLKVITSQLADLPTTDDAELGNITDQLNDLKGKLTAKQQLNNEQSKQIAEAQATIQHLVHDGSYYELRQQQANLQTEITNNVTQWLGYQSALNWLESAMNIITKGRVPKVLDLTTKYFAILTNQNYNKVIFQDTIRVVRQDDTIFDINELSKGTLEQLYFALVLALAVGFHEDFALPIIIDDGFVNFDGHRKQAAKELLLEIGKQNQVLFYTADINQLINFDSEQIIKLG
ncbi:AAA family ATPase [Lentilactobacillus senioris]|uniref:ATP-binding protein n=1 Tax=Lentilactobacillus senioris TaxID=931534 RepID=UPI002282A0F5|nr:AAA family ATPase [Lentilactobacillus senioris]MCY9806977.1 AAA family ATPase [Lentilactobacillus senioris]